MNAPQVPAGPFMLVALICDRMTPGTKATGFENVRQWFEVPKGGRIDTSGLRLALVFSRRPGDADTFSLDVLLHSPDGRSADVTRGQVVPFRPDKATTTIDARLDSLPEMHAAGVYEFHIAANGRVIGVLPFIVDHPIGGPTH